MKCVAETVTSSLNKKKKPLRYNCLQVSYSEHFANMWGKVAEETKVYANRSNWCMHAALVYSTSIAVDFAPDFNTGTTFPLFSPVLPLCNLLLRSVQLRDNLLRLPSLIYSTMDWKKRGETGVIFGLSIRSFSLATRWNILWHRSSIWFASCQWQTKTNPAFTRCRLLTGLADERVAGYLYLSKCAFGDHSCPHALFSSLHTHCEVWELRDISALLVFPSSSCAHVQ